MLYAFDFKYAGLVIDAAQDVDGNIWISTPTIETVLGYEADSCRKKAVSKSFKAFTGEGFALGKTKQKSTKLNTTNVYYSKESFLKLLYWEVSNANQKAIDLVVSGFVADFEGSIQNALGEQLTEEKREYLRELVFNRIQAFRKWTDIIRDRHIKFYGVKPEGWYYGKLVKKANLALFGVPEFGNDRTENMTIEQQETIKEFECYLARKARNNPDLEPEAVLNMALNQFTN
jgi:hypothetical protein